METVGRRTEKCELEEKRDSDLSTMREMNRNELDGDSTPLHTSGTTLSVDHVNHG